MNAVICICPTGDLGEGVAVVRVSDHESLRILAFFCESTRTAYYVTDLDTGALVGPEYAGFSPEMRQWQREDHWLRPTWLARAGLSIELPQPDLVAMAGEAAPTPCTLTTYNPFFPEAGTSCGGHSLWEVGPGHPKDWKLLRTW